MIHLKFDDLVKSKQVLFMNRDFVTQLRMYSRLKIIKSINYNT